MTDRVLSDAELTAAYFQPHPPTGSYACSDTLGLRAVEAAVLAKCIKINGMYGIDVRPPEGVTEREARRRERAAAENARSNACLSLHQWHLWLNERYPSPTCDKCGQEIK